MSRFVGDRRFYRMVLALALPILLQNAVSTFVNLLDNLMVGQLGTEPMSGVSIVNQLIFVFNLCIFGGTSGAGIFTAQYYGAGDHEGVRHSMRFKLLLGVGFGVLATVIFSLWGRTLAGLFLHESDSAGDLALTWSQAEAYLRVIVWSLIPFGISVSYAGTMRETGKAMLPMKASVAAVLMNLFLNWVLIFGNLGMPALGVRGAALATVISRYLELAIVVVFSHRNKKEYPYLTGLYRSLRIPGPLAKKILIKGAPLLVNEFFWSVGMTFLVQCYSYRGLDAVGALNISTTVSNLFNIVMFTMGNTVGIIMGNTLGEGKLEEAKQNAWRLMALSVAASLASGGLMAALSGAVPRLYNTSAEIRTLATHLLLVAAAIMPLTAITNASYFTLRSGGRTYITMLFDCVFVWVVNVPLAYVLIHYTALPLLPVYAIVSGVEAAKCVLGIVLVQKGVWLNRLTDAAGAAG